MAAEDLSNEADKKIGRVLQQKASNLAMSSAYPADCAPMSTDTLADVKASMKYLRKQKDATHFNQPVDWVGV